MKKWRFAGINFDHMHMGDLLRKVHEHEQAEIAAVYDPDPSRMEEAVANFSIPAEGVFTDLERCIKESKPDVAIVCAATAKHAEYVEALAAMGVHVFVEKPFAATLEQADRMIAAMADAGKVMMINWPLRWVASHITAKRFIDEGAIGEVREVHYYDGNRGPLWHGADKIEMEPTVERKSGSWFYKKQEGGGSLQDYLGYGVTLGTWFNGGKIPLEVTGMWTRTDGLEVDEHSVTLVRYKNGLSKFETRWGTFTDPWTHQPQPKCGFVICGSDGTIASYDYEPTIRMQTRDCPEGREVEVDNLSSAEINPIAYLIDCLEKGNQPDGPLSPEIARIGQQIVDTAFESAQQKRTLPLKQ